LLVVAGLLGAGWVILVWLPPVLVGVSLPNPVDTVKAENDARATLLQAVGGAVLVAGLGFTARSYLVTREGHVTDRYTAAVNQLGSEHLSVRLGGIYALERIARDSERDRITILQILTALIREAKHTDERPSEDVVAALQVLSNLPGSSDSRDLNLREVDLCHIRVESVKLRGADLSHSRLELAILPGADLRGARLDYANATRADLTGAQLQEARATQTNFQDATLDDAVLDRLSAPGASFHAASMHGVHASHATLTAADLRLAQLTASDRSHTRLNGASFLNAQTDGMDVQGVDLHEARDLTSEQRMASAHDRATRWPELA